MILAAVLVAAPASPALAGWKLVPHGAAAKAAGVITVTPGEDWNRSSRKPIKKGEVWTLDGANLNELYFVAGLIAGETLFKDIDKKNRPLPKVGASMVLTDIPEFFESSARITLNTSLFQIGTVAPAKFGAHDAVKFEYTYSVTGESLTRKGVAMGALVGGKLYLINFAAPSIHYYDRDAPKAHAIMASAQI
jgi:hypothetical protein